MKMRINNKTLIISILIFKILQINAICQNINKVDSLGRKQGPWYIEITKDSIAARLENPLVSCYFINDTLNGEYIIYSNLNPIVYLNYNKGKKDGVQKLYSNAKILTEISVYKEGEIVSKFYFYDKGRIEREEQYKNGLLNGICKRYYRNGKLWMIMPYVNGKLNGNFIHLNKRGKTFMIETYENGILKATKVN